MCVHIYQHSSLKGWCFTCKLYSVKCNRKIITDVE